MKKNIRYTLWLLACCILPAACTFFTACGNKNAGTIVTGEYYYPNQEQEQDETDREETEEQELQTPVIGADMYLIVSNDMTKEQMILEQLASGKQYLYHYSLTTSFLDKYGNSTASIEFEPGRVVTVGAKDSEGKLKEIQISDQVWEYPNITRYSVDEERGVFKIADTRYSYDSDIFVVSDGEKIRLSALSELDELKVIGIGKQILSVSVTTGHGEVRLENTSVFDGSYIQIGNKIFAEVTPNMKMEIPEGTYLVTVANKGYGGSTEIVVERNQETVVNLDELKGEGPKIGKILFAVDVADAVIKIDGKTVDYSQVQELQYGIHSIEVKANGYNTYRKKLFVNSEEATILIELTDSSSSTSTGNSGGANGSDATEEDREADEETPDESQPEENEGAVEENEEETDYLTTLSELLSAIGT